MKQAGKRHCAPRRAAHRPKKQPERTRIPQSAKQRRTAKKVHTMLKNFAEKVIRRDTKHNGRKTPRRMAKTMTPRGFFCLQKGGMSVGGKMTGLKFSLMECDMEKLYGIWICSAGIGGFREGLRRAGGFECAGHCEQDEHAERSYRALFDTRGEWFCEDIRKADAGSMPDFELLCGGFPCQSFSIAGSRHGFADPRGTLFFELARVAEARKPQYLLFENVPGLLNHDGGRTFAAILDTLDGLGYGVEWQVLNSKDFDVPQSRTPGVHCGIS